MLKSQAPPLLLPHDLNNIFVHSEKMFHCNFILKYPLEKQVDTQREIPFLQAFKMRRQFITYTHDIIARTRVVTN